MQTIGSKPQLSSLVRSFHSQTVKANAVAVLGLIKTRHPRARKTIGLLEAKLATSTYDLGTYDKAHDLG